MPLLQSVFRLSDTCPSSVCVVSTHSPIGRLTVTLSTSLRVPDRLSRQTHLLKKRWNVRLLVASKAEADAAKASMAQYAVKARHEDHKSADITSLLVTNIVGAPVDKVRGIWRSAVNTLAGEIEGQKMPGEGEDAAGGKQAGGLAGAGQGQVDVGSINVTGAAAPGVAAAPVPAVAEHNEHHEFVWNIEDHFEVVWADHSASIA